MNELQSLATFMRNLAYGDNQSHKIEWSLRIVHPSQNDGVIGYAGGIWNRYYETTENSVSISFSYDEVNRITNFKAWKNQEEIIPCFKKKPSFDEFKVFCQKIFEIEKLYECKKSISKRNEALEHFEKVDDIWTEGFTVATEKKGKYVKITPAMLQQIYKRIKVQDGKNLVSTYTNKRYDNNTYPGAPNKFSYKYVAPDLFAKLKEIYKEKTIVPFGNDFINSDNEFRWFKIENANDLRTLKLCYPACEIDDDIASFPEYICIENNGDSLYSHILSQIKSEYEKFISYFE